MKKLLIVLLCLGLVGCVTEKYNIRTTGYLDKTTTSSNIVQFSSFVVLENKNAQNPIFDKEIKRKIEKLLIKKGYSIAKLEEANYYLTFDYGIDEGNTMTGSQTIYNPSQQQTVSTYNPAGSGSWTRGTITTPASYSYKPVSITLFTRKLILKVYYAKNKEDMKDAEPIWIGENSSIGITQDLREVINYMLVGAFKYFGEDTKNAQKVTVSGNDKDVEELKATMD